jgi:hypothetical protein
MNRAVGVAKGSCDGYEKHITTRATPWCGIAGLLVKREAPSNSKIKRLCRLLDIPLYQAVGLLELLWHLTAREATRGDIGKLSNEDIALALDYRGDENKLIDTLVRTRWLDESSEHRLVIHDWHEHADEAVKKRLTRSGRSFIAAGHVATEPPNVEIKPQSGNLPRAGAGPEPEPEPHPEPEPEPEPELKAKSVVVPTSSAEADQPQLLALQGEPREEPATLQDYVEFWNLNCGSLPKVAKLNDERRRKLKARITSGLTAKTFGAAVRKVIETPFLMGDNERAWHASFDFIIASDTNIAKILEGSYGRAEKPRPRYRAMKDPVETLRVEAAKARSHSNDTVNGNKEALPNEPADDY